MVTTLADMDGKESFDASSLGQADEVTGLPLHSSFCYTVSATRCHSDSLEQDSNNELSNQNLLKTAIMGKQHMVSPSIAA